MLIFFETTKVEFFNQFAPCLYPANDFEMTTEKVELNLGKDIYTIIIVSTKKGTASLKKMRGKFPALFDHDLPVYHPVADVKP